MPDLFEQLNAWPLYLLPLIGLAFLFYGLRLFKFLLATACALSLGSLAFALGTMIGSDLAWLPWVMGAIAGLIGIWLASALERTGAFILGLSAGLMLFPAIRSFVPDDPNWMPWAVAGGLAIIGGLVGLIVKDRIIITLTSLYGASLFTHGFFLILMRHEIIDEKHFGSAGKPYAAAWLILFICLSICGIIHQKKQK